MISYKKVDLTNFNSFYKIFVKSLKEQFCHYTPNTISYFLEVDYPKKWSRQQIKSGRRLAFLALAKEEPVGYFLFGKPFGGVSQGIWLAVDPNYQNRGIGSKLTNLWKKEALKLGTHLLLLTTTKGNSNFYQKCGFTLLGIILDGYFGVDNYYLYKSLGNPEEKNYLK